MNKKLLLFGVCLLTSIGVKAQLYKYSIPYERTFWDQNVRENFFTYRSVEEAWKEGRENLQNATILNGSWKMKVTADTAVAVRETDLASWNSIDVPFVSYKEARPLFTPEKMPVMEETPDMIPTKEFTVFRTDAIVTFDNLDKGIFLHLDGVSGKTTVYVNGKKVGVLRESFIPYDIRITKDVVRGRNAVALVMEPYNEESLVERWPVQFSPCIPRDVYLYAQPKIRMYDFIYKTRLDPTYKNGILEAGLVLKTELINTHPVTVYYDLYDMKGKIVNSDYKQVDIGWYRHDTIRFVSSIQNVNLWSAKNPYLYTIVYRVKREGRTLENIIRKVGFRQVEVKDDSLLINGKAEPIYGINADLYPELTAAYNTKDRIKEILKGLKAQGFNAVRTPYPLQKEFYDAADSLGLYISETAPVCSKGLSRSINRGGTLANNPAWDSVFISRAVSTYEKGKGHTSIIIWELGEDAGNGYCFCNAYLALKRLDPYRPVAYSGAGYQWTSDICMGGRIRPGEDKPYIPSRMKYDKDYWNNHQGGFLAEKIEGRIAGSDYTESSAVSENLRPVENTTDIQGIWDSPKDTKEKKSLFGKKKKAPVEKTAAVAVGVTAEPAKLQAEKAKAEATKAQPTKVVKSTGPVTAEWTGENTLTIHNGLDCNLNKYNIIHGVEVNGRIDPVEMFNLDIEPGGTGSVKLMKTGKKKKAYLLIEDVAKIEL